MDQSTIRNHIIQGDTASALQAMDQASAGTKWHSQVVMLRSRFARMRDKERMLTEDSDDLAIEQNKINQALLDILEQMDEQHIRTAPTTVNTKSQTAIWKWLVPVAVIAGVIILVLQWTGDDDVASTAADERTEQTAERNTANGTDVPIQTSDATEQKSVGPARYEKHYVGKTDGDRYTPTEIRYLELKEAETLVQLNFKNDNTRPITIKEAFLTHEEEQSNCKEVPSQHISTRSLEAGEQKEDIKMRFPCVVKYPATFILQIQYELAGSGEERVYKIDFKSYERME